MKEIRRLKKLRNWRMLLRLEIKGGAAGNADDGPFASAGDLSRQTWWWKTRCWGHRRKCRPGRRSSWGEKLVKIWGLKSHLNSKEGSLLHCLVLKVFLSSMDFYVTNQVLLFFEVFPTYITNEVTLFMHVQIIFVVKSFMALATCFCFFESFGVSCQIPFEWEYFVT